MILTLWESCDGKKDLLRWSVENCLTIEHRIARMGTGCFRLSFWDTATLDRTISLVWLGLVGLDDLPHFYINAP